MKIAVLSDIHANLVALKQTLDLIDSMQTDAVWCLGDTVGYGPHPQECVDIIRARADICLAGNHDLAVVGKTDLAAFNPIAREAALWQRKRLTDESLSWLKSLPTRVVKHDITLAHASPRHPVWEYVDNELVAAENYDAFDTPLCLIGHSHLAIAWRMHRSASDGRIDVEGITEPPGFALALDIADKWLLNPGSVGQPRDHDPRASFAILDTDARIWIWHRIEYDILSVEKAIKSAGLPDLLGRRLYLGW